MKKLGLAGFAFSSACFMNEITVKGAWMGYVGTACKLDVIFFLFFVLLHLQ